MCCDAAQLLQYCLDGGGAPGPALKGQEKEQWVRGEEQEKVRRRRKKRKSGEGSIPVSMLGLHAQFSSRNGLAACNIGGTEGVQDPRCLFEGVQWRSSICISGQRLFEVQFPTYNLSASSDS
jgi:hypothetical protein